MGIGYSVSIHSLSTQIISNTVPLLLGWSSNRSIITIINSSTYRVIILGDKRNMDAFVGTSTGILKSTLHIFSIKYS